ncbi:MAG: phenylalanine--tRNA ligase subunit beta [Opitutae bacterium]|nr:phenylalanine--tRNA ligase subunit beta [Opitutae bacterium]
MKVSIDWLKQYVRFDATHQELTDSLPMLGLEVEESEDRESRRLENVVIGEVLSKEPHPEADRLSVCSVQVCKNQEPAKIVCGASNFVVGDRVPVALPGAKLPGGFKIKKSKLRGVDSEGMMCSAVELDLGKDADGLMILSEKPEIGTPIDQIFQKEITLELEITANRGDCLSHIGVAREIAAYYEKELVLPELKFQAPCVEKPSKDNLIHSLIVDSENCPLYTLSAIRGVKVGPSPEWLVKRLESVGTRSINNVVDITNFVLLETGQPLHAFDAKKIDSQSIQVRQAKENEKITTLDGTERTLDSDMMVIADSQNALVIAGVMGSVDAEVDDSTVDIILESAWFKPGNIRSTARRLGLHTDSSQRFARDIDPVGVDFGARRAIELILEIAGGQAVNEIVSLGQAPRSSRTIEIEKSFVEDRCGFEINADNLVQSWKRLGFKVEGKNPWQVQVPSFRSEVDRPIDLVEEFIRVYGTSDLNDTSVSVPALHRDNDQSYDFCDRAIENLSGQGYQEVCNYSLRSVKEIKMWFPHLKSDCIELSNPLTADHTHVRPSLLPGLLDALANNQKNLNQLSQVFETGRVFQPGPRGNVELVSVALASFPQTMDREWKKNENLNFFDIKRVIHRFFHATGINLPKDPWELLETESAPWQNKHATKKGDVHKNKIEIYAGIISLAISKHKNIKGPVLAAEILIDPILLSKKRKVITFQKFSSFPPAIKDLALVSNQSEPAEKVRSSLESVANQVANGKFMVDPVVIFDVFSGQGLDEGKKSVACGMRFRSPDRTLAEDEVNQAFEKIVEKINQDTPYTLRT